MPGLGVREVHSLLDGCSVGLEIKGTNHSSDSHVLSSCPCRIYMYHLSPLDNSEIRTFIACILLNAKLKVRE